MKNLIAIGLMLGALAACSGSVSYTQPSPGNPEPAPIEVPSADELREVAAAWCAEQVDPDQYKVCRCLQTTAPGEECDDPEVYDPWHVNIDG